MERNKRNADVEVNVIENSNVIKQRVIMRQVLTQIRKGAMQKLTMS